MLSPRKKEEKCITETCWKPAVSGHKCAACRSADYRWRKHLDERGWLTEQVRRIRRMSARAEAFQATYMPARKNNVRRLRAA